jgi:hypothetical protein
MLRRLGADGGIEGTERLGTASQLASNAPGTTRRREAQRVCRDLRLDLYLRRGAFWEHVQERRHRLQAQE